MEFIKKHGIIIIAFALPILLIAGIAVSVYLPGMFISTQYDFVYATCGDGINRYYGYDCTAHLNNLYSVKDGALVVNTIDPNQDTDQDKIPDIKENYTIRFFLHDTEANEGREITLAEAQGFSFSGLLTSPDGVAVENGQDRSVEVFPFFGGNYREGFYLTKGSKQRRIDLINENDGYYYNNNFKFIGWVLPR